MKYPKSYTLPMTLSACSIVVFVGPILVSLGISFLAEFFGCSLSSMGATTCLINEKDFGDILYSLFLIHWLILPGLFFGGIGLFFSWSIFKEFQQINSDFRVSLVVEGKDGFEK